VLAALGFLALSCFREAYPCDEQTATLLAAECRAKYAQCQRAGHADDCPATQECTKKALDRQEYCAKQFGEDP